MLNLSPSSILQCLEQLFFSASLICLFWKYIGDKYLQRKLKRQILLQFFTEMRSNKGLTFMLILLLLLTVGSLSFKKLPKPLSGGLSPSKSRVAASVKTYSMFRHFLSYFWGRSQFQKIQKSVSQHAIKYGTYYVLVYNIIYTVLFIKKYLQDRQHKEQKISEILTTYQSRMRSYQDNDLTRSQVKSITSVLQDNIWILQKRPYSSLKHFTTQVTVTQVTSTLESKYKIVMTGVDELGTSDLKGVLTITKDGMQMKIIKHYDNYFQLMSNQMWREIIYEGQSDMDFEWQGSWYCVEDSKDPDQSGVWTFRRKYSQY